MSKLQKWSANGVIVTVYKESSTVVGPRTGKISSSKSSTRSYGYDRRAELLAYAHHLRNVGVSLPQQHHNHSPTDSNSPNKPKKRKGWLLARLKALKFSFGRLFGGGKEKAWKYENVDSKGHKYQYRSCPSPHRGKGKDKTSKRLRRVLKQFSCGCSRSKGNDKDDEQFQDLHNAK